MAARYGSTLEAAAGSDGTGSIASEGAEVRELRTEAV